MKKLTQVSAALVLMMMASPAFAQTTEVVATESGLAAGLRYLAAGLAIGLAVLGGAGGQGRAASSAYEGIGRNPQSGKEMFTPLLLGLALIEFQTIMAFIIAILLVLK